MGINSFHVVVIIFSDMMFVMLTGYFKSDTESFLENLEWNNETVLFAWKNKKSLLIIHDTTSAVMIQRNVGGFRYYLNKNNSKRYYY